MNVTIRVALVGLDHWYTAIALAEAISARDDVALAGIADAEPDRAGEVAQRSGCDRVEQQWRALVEDPDIDAVASFISTEQNPDVCVAAAEAGKHLLSIKPLARNLEEATRVVAAVRRAGVHFLPAESRHRLSDLSTTLKLWLTEGRLGELVSASFSLWAGLPQRWPGDIDPGWFADPARAPGGAWIDHAIYQLDLLRFLLDDEVASVSGRVANLRDVHLPVEDWGVATVACAGGTQAILEDTWTSPQGRFQQSTTLVCSKGGIRLDGIRNSMQVLGGFPPFSGWVETEPLQRRSDGIDHWLALIRGEAKPVATVDDAWRNLAACSAFYEAARSGRTVTPQELPNEAA